MTRSSSLLSFYNAEGLRKERYASAKFWEKRYHNKRLEMIQMLLRTNIFSICNSFADVGCGTGEYLKFSREFIDEADGVDLSKEYLRRCKHWKPDNLTLADVRFLPFKDCAYDCVLCSEVIEHVNEIERSINEVLRIARKFVVFSTPNQGLIRLIFSRFARNVVDQVDSKVGHVSIMRFSDLLGRMPKHGWKICTAFTEEVFPPSLDDIGFPRVATPLIRALEIGSDLLLPTLGSISFVVLQRETV